MFEDLSEIALGTTTDMLETNGEALREEIANDHQERMKFKLSFHNIYFIT